MSGPRDLLNNVIHFRGGALHFLSSPGLVDVCKSWKSRDKILIREPRHVMLYRQLTEILRRHVPIIDF